MPRYTLSILGMEVTFRTDADEDRIKAAQNLLEERFGDLTKAGGTISKEKLLACLGLSLADDYLESQTRIRIMEERISELLEKTP